MCCRTVDDNGQAATVDESALSAHTMVRKETPTTGGTNSVTLDSGEGASGSTGAHCLGLQDEGGQALLPPAAISEPPTDHICIKDALPTLNDDEQDEEEDEPADGKGINPSPAALPPA